MTKPGPDSIDANDEFFKTHVQIIKIMDRWNCREPELSDTHLEALKKILKGMQWADEELRKLRSRLHKKDAI